MMKNNHLRYSLLLSIAVSPVNNRVGQLTLFSLAVIGVPGKYVKILFASSLIFFSGCHISIVLADTHPPMPAVSILFRTRYSGAFSLLTGSHKAAKIYAYFLRLKHKIPGLLMGVNEL